MKLFAAIVIILTAHPAGASDRPLACLPSEQFQIGGIGPRDDISKVETLGPALATETYGGEDDGGYYEGSLQKFESLEINYQQLRGIERVATATNGADLPGSIRIGMPLTQVGELLHFGTAWLANRHHITLPVCGEDTGAEVHLHFSEHPSDPLLSKVELLHYGP